MSRGRLRTLLITCKRAPSQDINKYSSLKKILGLLFLLLLFN